MKKPRLCPVPLQSTQEAIEHERTKKGAQSLRMKMRKAELYFHVFEGSCSFLSLAAACMPELASIKAAKTRLFPLVQLQVQEQAFK